MSLTPAEAEEEIKSAARSQRVREGGHLSAFRCFSDWCDVNGLVALPTDEETMLLYLYSRHDELAYNTVANYARDIALAHEEAGFPDPRGSRTRTYLTHTRRSRGVRKLPMTDAMTLDEMESAVTIYCEDGMTADDHLHRGIYCVGWYVNATAEQQGLRIPRPLSAAYALPREAFTVSPRTVRVTHDTIPTVVIHASEDPVAYNAVVRALEIQPASDRPLLPTGGFPQANSQVRRALGAKSYPRTTAPRGVSWQVQETAVSRDDRDWKLRALRPRFHTALTRLTLLLVGVVTTRRAIDLSRLTLADVGFEPRGLTLHIGPEEKGSVLSMGSGGPPRSKTYVIEHVTNPAAPEQCSVLCPACALDSMVEWRRRQGARDTDALFVSMWLKPLSTAAIHEGIKAIWNALEASDPAATRDQAVKRIGSRSLRVTGVTLAAQAGASMADLADLMMCNLRNVPVYNRNMAFLECTPLRLRAA